MNVNVQHASEKKTAAKMENKTDRIKSRLHASKVQFVAGR
jgi:hypothetical protein